MVTDLDAHLTQRAPAAVSAELTRRERVLAAAGAKDLEEFTERGSLQPRYRPLPGLVIVIDELASLIRDLPASGGQPRPSGPPGAGHALIPFGLIDLPALQRQRPAVIDLDTFGHLMAAGDARRARRGCLTAPQTLPEGDLIGAPAAYLRNAARRN
jgi:DNA segregation ATPase FtsK/SpoIIIE-like protein